MAAPAAIPPTMRAVRYTAFGGPFETVTLPTPTPAKGEVLVKVAAAALNPIDWKLHAGVLPRPIAPLPKVPGADLAGVVVATGPAASRFAVGADVYGIKSATDKAGGALAEYATVPEAQLAARPSSLSPAQAASLPLAGLTALQALDAARVKAGDRVLVTAAAGGVGSLAVQLAVARGATVVGTCGPRNVDFVKSIGCADAVDYTRGPLAPQLADGGGFDVVLDMMGGAVEAETIKLASRPGARFQSVLNSGTSALAIAGAKVRQWVGAGPKYGVTILSVKRAGDGLRQFNDLVAAAKLAPVVAGAPRPLEEAGAAFEELKAGHVRGKLVVEV